LTLGDPQIFDLRLMGAVHAALFLFTFYLFLPLVRSLTLVHRWGILLVVLLIFTDVMYVSYFNSLYMDTAALLETYTKAHPRAHLRSPARKG